MNEVGYSNQEGIKRNLFNSETSNAFTNEAGKGSTVSSLESMGNNRFEVAESIQNQIDTLTFSFTKEQLPNGWHERLTCRNGEVKSLQKNKFIVEGNQIIEHTLAGELIEAKRAVSTACKIVQEKKVELQKQLNEFQNLFLLKIEKSQTEKPKTEEPKAEEPKTWGQVIKDFFQGIYSSITGFFSWILSFMKSN